MLKRHRKISASSGAKQKLLLLNPEWIFQRAAQIQGHLLSFGDGLLVRGLTMARKCVKEIAPWERKPGGPGPALLSHSFFQEFTLWDQHGSLLWGKHHDQFLSCPAPGPPGKDPSPTLPDWEPGLQCRNLGGYPYTISKPQQEASQRNAPSYLRIPICVTECGCGKFWSL